MKLSQTNLMQIVLTFFMAAVLNAQSQNKPVPEDRSNFISCLKGLSGCDISTLGPNELRLVAEASKKRNVDACLDGSSLCDPTRLTSANATSVQAALYRR